ncbi:MAG TPA: DUF1178 family protein [Allosphingosinicella sp.]|nr:DUF1178 family protein [Allosphingosinicella sp.]
MIIFDLKCAPSGHVFEAWFGSTADYEAQKARGLVSCPLCGSDAVEKAPMAPAVGAKGNAQKQGGAPELVSGSPAQVKAMLAAAAAMQKTLLEGSEAVGDQFAEEARAIHLGEAEKRAIHGRATRAQAESLIDDGIPVAPLPFPIVDPAAEN